jgi:hypothetical protein
MARKVNPAGGKPEAETKARIRKLARLVTEFLESPPKKEELGTLEEQQRVIDLLTETLGIGQILEYADDLRVQIYMVHHLLDQLWEELKKQIMIAQDNLNKPEGEDPHSFHCMNVEMAVPVTLKIQASFHTKLVFFDTCLDSLKALINLMHGLPIDYFKTCKGCGCFFIHASLRQRQYCTQKCAAKDIERIKRNEQRENFNRYHRNRYRIKKGLPL